MNRTHDYADFQPGDGTRYHLTLVPEEHGGIMIVCNRSSCWRFYEGNLELKFIFGDYNEYTRIAITEYMTYWQKCLGWDN